MDVHVIASDQNSFKVRFSDVASGVDFVISVEMPVFTKWSIQTNQLLPTATMLAEEILLVHGQTSALEAEYSFSAENTQPTLEQTIENIRANAS